MELRESEIQVLATLAGALEDGRPADRGSLETRGADLYRLFQEDWADAFSDLAGKGLIGGDERGYRLTAAGAPLARAYRRERPDQYWYFYRRFYRVAHESPAYARFCERVYGAPLCQHGLMDMASLEELIAHLELHPGERFLDLGCGPGIIAEHISDKTGAAVTGLDTSAPAIAAAQARTRGKGDRLSFFQADMNALDLPVRSFDAAISIDTLYFVADIQATLAKVLAAMKPGGLLAVFWMQWLEEGDPPETLEADRTWLARAFAGLGLDTRAFDHSPRIHAFWPRARDAALSLRDDFEAEGNGFIARHWIMEAEEHCLLVEAGQLTRYLYLARV